MKTIDVQSRVNFEKYKPHFSVTPLAPNLESTPSTKPIVDIQYINVEDIGAKSPSLEKPQPKSTDNVDKPSSATRTQKNKQFQPVFSLSNMGIVLAGMGTLECLSAKQYLAGSLLIGGGLLSYGIGKSLENRK